MNSVSTTASGAAPENSANHIDENQQALAANLSRTRLAHALVRTAQRDRCAFRDVYALTSAKLSGICLRVCGERTAAEDVLHDVYLTIWFRAGSWQPARSSPITWMATIARNRAIDWRRKHGRYQTTPLNVPASVVDPAPTPEMVAQSSRENQLLHACLDQLEPRQAASIRAAFLGGLTYSELAALEGVPLTTMTSRIRRGLAKLQTELSTSACDD